MRVLKNIWNQMHMYVLWLMLSVILWGWIFGLLTDARPAHKLLLCVDRTQVEEQALSVELEKERPAGIRVIRAHRFAYYLFEAGELEQADLYIVGESRAEEYLAAFLPLEEAGVSAEGRQTWTHEGQAYGLLIYDAETGEGAASAYIAYPEPGQEAENCYLFFGANSVHLEDGAAEQLAERLLSMP